MTYQQALDLLNPDDKPVLGVHRIKLGIRLETLDTQAGMRAYYKWKARAKGCRVVCGETNNGTGRFYVRITRLED